MIYTIKGTSSVVEDTKNLYLELFEDARIKYNKKQTNDTTSNLREANDINVIIQKYEDDLR